MLRCEERIACTQAITAYELLDDYSKQKIPKDFVEYLYSHCGPPIMKKFMPNMIVKEQSYTAYGKILVDKILSYLKK